MDIGTEGEPYIAEPLEDPFHPAEPDESPAPVRAPEEVPAGV